MITHHHFLITRVKTNTHSHLRCTCTCNIYDHNNVHVHAPVHTCIYEYFSLISTTVLVMVRFNKLIADQMKSFTNSHWQQHRLHKALAKPHTHRQTQLQPRQTHSTTGYTYN